MGVFSWITSDTHDSIPASGNPAGRETFEVFVLQPGGRPTLRETDYNGYGDFGGRDVYALVAEWHGEELTGDDSVDRDAGIDISFDSARCKFPIKIVRDGSLKYEEVEASESCEFQGYFYDDEIIECDNCSNEVSYHGELCYSCEMEERYADEEE
jgi:hypothetical protein